MPASAAAPAAAFVLKPLALSPELLAGLAPLGHAERHIRGAMCGLLDEDVDARVIYAAMADCMRDLLHMLGEDEARQLAAQFSIDAAAALDAAWLPLHRADALRGTPLTEAECAQIQVIAADLEAALLPALAPEAVAPLRAGMSTLRELARVPGGAEQRLRVVHQVAAVEGAAGAASCVPHAGRIRSVATGI